MAHKEQIDYCLRVKDRFKEHFINRKVLDCGSLDINGSNRSLFQGGSYIGVDVGPGINVDIVSKVHELTFDSATFDTIVSTEMLEHDMFYEKSLIKMSDMLAPGGLLLLTCATTGRMEHGTRKSLPSAAPLLSNEWSDYYKNLTEEDFKSIPGFMSTFSFFEFETDAICCDLRFFGIKKYDRISLKRLRLKRF